MDAELILGNMFNKIETRQGSKNKKSKTKTINEIGFTKRQYTEIQKLTHNSVDEAKELARKEGKIVTRNDAISIIKEKHKAKNNVEFTQKSGIYDTKYRSTHNPARIKNPINYSVLFANVGIGEYYLEENGFNATVASELLPERTKWYKELHPNCNVLQGDINNKIDEIVDAYKKA